MDMAYLIYSYHLTVIIVILATTAATIGAITKKGMFSEVNESYTKVLVFALLVEMTGAFIGVYTTLPQLKLKVSEKYMFEMNYSDVASIWKNSLSEENRVIVATFGGASGMERFKRLKEFAASYEKILYVDSIAHLGGAEVYEKVLNKEEAKLLDAYQTMFGSNIERLAGAELLLFEMARLKQASNTVGRGTMWASTINEKLEGIVVYGFPGQLIPSVIEFHGRKTDTRMTLYFEQKPSAFEFSSDLRFRGAKAFTVNLELIETGQYSGNLLEFGNIVIQVWEV